MDGIKNLFAESGVMSAEDMAGLSLRRLENMDDLIEELAEADKQPATLDIEKDVNEMVRLHELICHATIRKDWDDKNQLQEEFSKLVSGNPAYGRFKKLKDGHTMDEFISAQPEEDEDDQELAEHWIDMYESHHKEMRRFQMPESEASAYGFWAPHTFWETEHEWRDILREYSVIRKEIRAIKERIAECLRLKDMAQTWMSKAKDVHEREERTKRVRRYYALNNVPKLSGLQAILDELQDNLKEQSKLINYWRERYGMPSYSQWMKRQKELRYLKSQIKK